MRVHRYVSVALGVAAMTITAYAGTRASGPPSYELSWYTIDGGGGTSTGANYSLSGTIGQPDAGVMTGGNISLSGGFWTAGDGPAPTCLGDLVTSATFQRPPDGLVDGADLAYLLGDWGANPGSIADIVTNATFQPPPDGIVDGADLAVLLGAWGACQ